MKKTNLKDFLQKDIDKLPAKVPEFIDNLIKKVDEHISKWWRILILTLTKKSSEEVTNFLVKKGYKAYYLHSEVATLDRREIIKKLKTGQIDIIVWVNLLREWIDLPEVSLIAILDADKEGFLRSTTSLIQIIWRASRNLKWEVILYADNLTESMIKSLRETYRRRKIQEEYNVKNNIIPQKADSNVKLLESVKTDDDLVQWFDGITRWKIKRLKRATKAEKAIISKDLRMQLDDAIKNREFEKAAVIRDQLKELDPDS